MKLTQFDLLSGERTVLVDGNGHLNGNFLVCWEDEKHTIRHEVEFGKDHVVIKRFADVKSETRLMRGQKGIASVKSEYGEFRLDTVLDSYLSDEDTRVIKYRIMQNDETVTQQKMVWELRGLKDE